MSQNDSVGLKNSLAQYEVLKTLLLQQKLELEKEFPPHKVGLYQTHKKLKALESQNRELDVINNKALLEKSNKDKEIDCLLKQIENLKIQSPRAQIQATEIINLTAAIAFGPDSYPWNVLHFDERGRLRPKEYSLVVEPTRIFLVKGARIDLTRDKYTYLITTAEGTIIYTGQGTHSESKARELDHVKNALFGEDDVRGHIVEIRKRMAVESADDGIRIFRLFEHIDADETNTLEAAQIDGTVGESKNKAFGAYGQGYFNIKKKQAELQQTIMPIVRTLISVDKRKPLTSSNFIAYPNNEVIRVCSTPGCEETVTNGKRACNDCLNKKD